MRSAKQARGRETVEQLVEAAMAVYAEGGPERFTLTAVVEAGGVSVGSLYHHFGSFDVLAAEVWSRCMADLLDHLGAALRATRTARTGIRALVVGYLRWAAEHRAQAHFLLVSPYAGHVLPHAERMRAGKAERMEAMAAWFAPHVAAGRIQDLPPALIEMLVIGPVAETVRRWLAGVPGIDLDEAARLLPDRVWQSVRGPDS
ncbi:TetR/AcrR family transcriptional regulator [Nonomuraea montanisoli]|nr:TetR/AcrR family transcriptional regulator [Nonomuraea montanisoli]